MTMLERMANALRPFCFPSDTDIAARAALEAMREPTEAMVRDGLRVPVQFDAATVMVDGKAMWQAMIDAALAERD